MGHLKRLFLQSRDPDASKTKIFFSLSDPVRAQDTFPSEILEPFMTHQKGVQILSGGVADAGRGDGTLALLGC